MYFVRLSSNENLRLPSADVWPVWAAVKGDVGKLSRNSAKIEAQTIFFTIELLIKLLLLMVESPLGLVLKGLRRKTCNIDKLSALLWFLKLRDTGLEPSLSKIAVSLTDDSLRRVVA